MKQRWNRYRRRALAVEPLEQRLPLSGETFLVNFQLASEDVPNRYLADTGEVFGVRATGQRYGWSSDHTDVSRDRDTQPDQRLDTLVHFHESQFWEFALPNGTYDVTASIGDPSFDSTHTLNVEETNYWNSVPLLPGEFRTMTGQVTVSDGRLTLDQGAAFEKATRINYLIIQGVPASPNGSPQAPIITEPASGSSSLNPADVHLEATTFVDPDGDTHLSSDWEIWTVGPSGERVWATFGIGGVERLHTHLGDGFFEQSHAGRVDLMPDTDYELRVRFRDTAGSVSDDSVRSFRTGAASTVFPLELDDISNNSPIRWENTSQAPIELPAASTPAELRVESASGDLLLSISGSTAAGNTIVNPPPLVEHGDVRVVVSGGSIGLFLEPSDLSFPDGQSRPRMICLPAINLAAGTEAHFWVAVDGSTYVGLASQGEPVFTTLARQCQAELPFIATQPNYVVEMVAEGFQLPVNVAFVPEPGPLPDDPAFYVTELYGTIRVVTNDGTVATYADNLLNFDPTGNFPGSGEQGLAGIVVDPVSGDLFVTRVTDTDGLPGGEHHPQVLRFSSLDGGRTAASQTVILDMVGESQGQSHQISNASLGPDGKLYIHNGDGFDASTALNVNSYRGKVLRMNLDGTPPTDNPFYNAGNSINSQDYIYAYGVRNPFGGAWRAADGAHYAVENGPSVDRLARIDRGAQYGWDGSNASMFNNALYNWVPAHAPVNITFVQSETFSGSQFPADKMDRAFVSESGPTYAEGPQLLGKRIVEFAFDESGQVVGGPTPLVEYIGTGRATVVGLTAGPDGLYFTDLYKDENAQTPIDAGARVWRVRYVPPAPDGDFNQDGSWDCLDIDALVHEIASSSNSAAFDMTQDAQVNQDDLLSLARRCRGPQSAAHRWQSVPGRRWQSGWSRGCGRLQYLEQSQVHDKRSMVSG